MSDKKQKVLERKCKNCGKLFKTRDPRKVYHARNCGGTFRARKQYQRLRKAAKELDKLLKGKAKQAKEATA